jgi:hypothetical protein
MPEPLMLKIITDADDTGVRKIQRGMGDLEISSRKASHATKEFLRELGNVSDTSDLASVALGSFSKVLAGSLAGTALIIGGKAVIDVFRKVTEIVDKSKESFDNLVEGLGKGGLPKTFQEGATQAGKLSDEVAKINKEIDALSKGEEVLAKGDIKGWFMGLAATVMDSTNQLVKLREEAKKLAGEKMFAGATAELQTARETTGMTPQQMEQYKLRKQFEQDVDKADYQTGLVLLEKYNLDKGNIDDKYNRQKESDTREATDSLRKIRMDEFQSEIDSQNRKTELESASFFESIAQKKKEQEQAMELVKAQEKLNDLLQKKLDLQDALNQAQGAQTIRQGEIATATAGVGGSLRGAGQRQTSFEIGLKRQADRAAKQESARAAEVQNMLIRADLRKAVKSFDANAVQNEKIAMAKRGAAESARKQFEDSYQKQIDKTTQSLKDNQKQIDDLSKSTKDGADSIDEMQKSATANGGGGGGGAGGGGGKTLADIYTLLKDNLIELKTYAHAA